MNFLITALILFCLLKAMNRLMTIGQKKEEKPAAPTTKKCPYCQTEIDIAATRCPHCTSYIEPSTRTTRRKAAFSPNPLQFAGQGAIL